MSDKTAQWQEIKRRAPGLAEMLSGLNGTFGKVRLGAVEFGQEESDDAKFFVGEYPQASAGDIERFCERVAIAMYEAGMDEREARDLGLTGF